MAQPYRLERTNGLVFSVRGSETAPSGVRRYNLSVSLYISHMRRCRRELWVALQGIAFRKENEKKSLGRFGVRPLSRATRFLV
jgi:hypothetical protein